MLKRILFVGFIVFLALSCGNDDEGFESIPPRLLAEVSPENDEEIREFLDTHFFNYEEFETPPLEFDFKIRIDTIAGDNSDKRPLAEFMRDTVITVSSFELLLGEEETDVPHTLYYLSLRPGIGGAASPEGRKPTVADSVFVRYEGKTLDGSSFDGADNPVWFDLARLQDLTQGFRGFAEGVPKFVTGGAPISNPDGTVDVEDFGIGLIIFPSGLGSFSTIRSGIPQYSPLMFTIDLFTLNETDHDGDGVPSIQEDVDGNRYLYDDNTDFESETGVRFANFQDPDDDGDGVLTRDEISDSNGNIIFPYPDSNNDGTPDYLDPDVN
nr:hypothetical protein [Allomuricauda sp.]